MPPQGGSWEHLGTLLDQIAFVGATCFLVSQFILEPQARTDFFESIAGRLKPGGFLASSDLASDVNAKAYDALPRNWLIMMLAVSIPAAGLEQMREACARDVAILHARAGGCPCSGGGI